MWKSRHCDTTTKLKKQRKQRLNNSEESIKSDGCKQVGYLIELCVLIRLEKHCFSAAGESHHHSTVCYADITDSCHDENTFSPNYVIKYWNVLINCS